MDDRSARAPGPGVRPQEQADRGVASALGIRTLRYLDRDGHALGEMPDVARSADTMVALYRAMVLTRVFDQKAVALQRTGRLGTFASSLGQEAIGTGVASAMTPQDVLLPSFREQSAQLWRGVTMQELLLYWGGDERGSDFAACREDFPICVPVATHMPHAAGVALAFRMRREPRVAVAMAGDGATSKGDFYEAMNVAGVLGLPCVFVIANNQWAISVPRSAQTAAETLAQKAVAAGLPGVQVDGNDVVAVHEVTRLAIERARNGGGPTLIEAVTYRLGDHTTADDARRYRDDAEVSPHWEEEPVRRLRQFLVDAHGWSREDEEGLLEDCRQAVEDAAAAYEDTPPEPVTALFDSLFQTLPAGVARQRAEAISEEAADG